MKPTPWTPVCTRATVLTIAWRSGHSTQCLVEAPDGTQSLFQLTRGEWKLVQIGDRFNNRIWFTYSTPNAWVITDNHGRTQTVYFKADPAGYYPAIIDRVVLAAFNATTATYTFNYTAASIPRPGIDNTPRRLRRLIFRC